MFKFKVENNDMGAVAGRIQEAGIWINTPTRALSSKELSHGEKVTNEETTSAEFPHVIYEVNRYFQKRSILSFIKDYQVAYRIQKQIEKDSNKGGNRITLFHPVLDKDLEITEEINSKLIALQLQCNLDAVSILDDYKTSPKIFEERLKKSMKQIDDDSPIEPMPTLRLDVDEKVFMNKIKVILNNDITLLDVIYAPITKYYTNYVYLSKVIEKYDLWIHMSEVERLWRSNYRTSMMHILPFLGISTFAIKSRPLPFGLFKITMKKAKRFDGRCLGHITNDEHSERYGEDLNCNCFVDKGQTLSNFYESFSGASLLNSALICHETNGSLREFMNFRKEIVSSSCRDYTREKEFLKEPFKRIFNIDLNNKNLN